MISQSLDSQEYNNYYQSYIDLAADIDIVRGLEHNLSTVLAFYSSIPSELHNYAYAEGKWTIKDILLHIIDTERIFAYRALRIARKDFTPLAGFEQDDYVISAEASQRSLVNIMEEYKSVRLATIALFKTFNENSLTLIGVANNSPISVRAIGYILTGHENHHNLVIKNRYLKSE